MRVDLLTREYPPHVYGGAGVHVASLAEVLRDHVDVRVRAFAESGGAARIDTEHGGGTEGDPAGGPAVSRYPEPADLAGANAALRTLGVDLRMAAHCAGADLVHSHTWYANLAGHLAGLLNGIPHVVSAHSLEPLRPWKAEQLGGGYAVSAWAERVAYQGAAAVVAVSAAMREDILACYPGVDPARVHVIHNGIDLDGWRRSEDADATAALGIDAGRPSVVFVGRMTRQKGLPHLLRAARRLPGDVQLVLCVGAADTPEIAAEVASLVGELRERRDGVVWIDRMLPRPELCRVLSAATAFVCPSVYEPLGIVNLEAMACETPVVGTATGGIPEVVVDGVTGRLVPIEQVTDGTGTPVDPERFETDLADALVDVVSDPERARQLGRAGRARAEQHFSWAAVGARTAGLYREVLTG